MSARACMRISGAGIRGVSQELVAILDDAHRAGLDIPADAQRAVAIITALGAAWEANGNGEPAPADVLVSLGLTESREPGAAGAVRPAP